MLAGLDLFLGAVDRILQLLNVRGESRRRFFKEVIDPLFQELEPVVADYLKFFASCREEIQRLEGSDLRPAIGRLNALRDDMHVARSKVRAFADALSASSQDPDVRVLAMHVRAIFESSRMRSPEPNKSMAWGFIQHIESADAGSKEDLVGHVSSIRMEVEAHWHLAGRTYEKLRIESMR